MAAAINPRMGNEAAEAKRTCHACAVPVNTHASASLPPEWMMSCQVTRLGGRMSTSFNVLSYLLNMKGGG